MKTLVIHPHDPSTNFLKEVYAERDFTVYNHNHDILLNKSIAEHDRIIMMGHGGSRGLYNRYLNELIDTSHVKLLKEKELIGVWCYANEFFEYWKLNGKYTGMIISEMGEANILAVQATGDEIKRSNVAFALALREAIDSDDFVSVMQAKYDDPDNPIVVYNRGNVFNRRNGDVIRLNSIRHRPVGDSHFFTFEYSRELMLSRLYDADIYVDEVLYHVKSVHLAAFADMPLFAGEFGLIVKSFANG